MDLGLTLSFTSSAPINPHRIVAATGTDGQIAQAGAPTDTLIGVTGPRGAEAAGKPVDVMLSSVQPVTAGGAFAFGDPLTSASDGKAVLAAPAAGANARIVGIALEAGATDALTRILVVPGLMQGA
ncbi:capsid cement protein [Roseospira visakhapatnamensis]|uniref:DUF2190 domain-containing protein n=1 Tax=Roseospira visakhapatnamensis TaxID=390880 RepID=A0A7W6WAJ0_9PROT|nr:capsid cement protein [Roseospira visakhapatnamensis]MBB4266898.1 hypothetical protein [Roseospira visakhapatnamensis]